MTGLTRNYLADLALRKGVFFPDQQYREQAWASKKIEELQQMPDVEFPEITEKDTKKIDSEVEQIKREILAWTFAE